MYRILTISKPTPEFPPVTMKTLPIKSGTSFSVKVGLGGKNWERSLPILAMTSDADGACEMMTTEFDEQRNSAVV